MSKNKGVDYFYFKPFRSGSVSYPQKNEAIYIIDILTRDDIIYFDDFGYLITQRALEVLQENNLKGVKVDHAVVKFSIQHNMKYKDQKVPKYYRLIPLPYDDKELKEVFLDEQYNLIINDRIKEALLNNVALNKLRLKHAFFDEVVLNDVVDKTEEDEEEPVLKSEVKSWKRQIIIFTAVMAIVGYFFFK